MGSKDWGRLFARVLAVMLVVQTVNSTIWTLLNLDSIPVGSLTPQFAMVGATVMVGILLWVFADRFAPSAERQENTDQTSFGTMIVVGIGMYIAFSGLGQFLTAWFDLRSIEGFRPLRTVASLWWNAVLVVVAVLTLLNSRRMTRWMLR